MSVNLILDRTVRFGPRSACNSVFGPFYGNFVVICPGPVEAHLCAGLCQKECEFNEENYINAEKLYVDHIYHYRKSSIY